MVGDRNKRRENCGWEVFYGRESHVHPDNQHLIAHVFSLFLFCPHCSMCTLGYIRSQVLGDIHLIYFTAVSSIPIINFLGEYLDTKWTH